MVKILSYNVRVLREVSKKKDIQCMIIYNIFNIFCIKKTKLELVDDIVGSTLWKSSGMSYLVRH